MANAAATFVYNEIVNLPIWVDYYGKLFGRQNLFVLDRSSDDGSTEGLEGVNVIRLPRTAFDEDAKTNLMSSFHRGLTSCFDWVVMTDCDEILVPDPSLYKDLNDYIDKYSGDYVNAMGVDLIHLLTEELPLDFTKPIMSQRSIGRFHSPECKHLLSRLPMTWLPGLHSSDKMPKFDPHLINFHLKLMDYPSAVARQMINLETKWSEASLERNYGAHHRYSMSQFVHQSFFVPIDVMNRKQVYDFEFADQIQEMESKTIRDNEGFYRVPMNVSKFVYLPERFKNAF